MIRAIIRFLASIIKAIFRLKSDIDQENQQTEHEQQEHLQEHQDHLQTQYDQIDEQHQVPQNPTLQDVQDELNDRF